MSDERPAEGLAQRAFTGTPNIALSVLCFLIAFGHIYVAFDPIISETQRNAYHFAGFAFLAAVLHPMLAGKTRSKGLFTFDLCFGLLIAASAIYLPYAEQGVYDRGVKFVTLDWVAAGLCVIGAIELTRRLTGWVIPILIIIALTYVGFWGKYIGGVFSFPGLSWESIAFRSIYGDDAMFGTIARISSTYVFLFIIFGAFLLRSGAGDFVINIARAIAGRLVGGPGIVAVIASGLTGTISGSAVANTASTGVITIPLMKKAGFPSKFAGGVEAASSTGGQLMPPIMGAGAFVMASFTQIPYETIVAAAALPALLYFLSVTFFVRIEARRLGLKPMENDGETLGTAFKKGGASFVIPIGGLIGMLVAGFTPAYAAVFGILAVIGSSWLTENRMGPKAVAEAMIMGTKGMIMTAVLLCAVGLVVNVIATAGIGNTFSLMISNWAGGNLLIAIVLVAIASLVLGMGLPVTAAYIVLATLSAPALAGMISDRFVIEALAAGTMGDAANAILMFGIPDPSVLAGPLTSAEASAIIKTLPLEVAAPLRDLVVPQEVAVAALLSAHMIIFWLSQDSNVTPPVALAAFTAAAIAKAP
ncbi:TRAP transporter fused permease subunit, partial [Yoonia sp. I 8.24]|uniref:TRAP transporter permease n=1 Tax=Yoonia sp. I 8.24 TaxID=1537229 RepID=UPI001EDE0FC3